MFYRVVTLIVLVAVINFLMGCSTIVVQTSPGREYETFPKDDPEERLKLNSPPTSEKIIAITLLEGQVIHYDDAGGIYRPKYGDRTQVIVGRTNDGLLSVTPVDQVSEALIQRSEFDVVATVGVLAGIGLIAFIIAIAAKQSCPFVYTYDGERWTFDGEPYGGAISRGLQKTDYSRLEHLKPVDGKYQLIVRNEADETQHTDELKLLVVDHREGTQIAPNYSGKMFAFQRTISPLSVVDETNRNLFNFFRDRDEIKWQTQLPVDSEFLSKDLRHHLTFTFPKPKNPSHTKLLVNAGTALWGSNMIKQMLLLRGNKVDEWYKDIDRHGTELTNLYYFMDREELYTLKVNVWEKSHWVQRAIMYAGGPLIDEDRIIDIDLSHADGDSIQIQLNPPFGYWKIDYLGLIDDAVSISAINELSAIWGEDQDGHDVTRSLASSDEDYYSMPKVGDWSKLSFAVPTASASPGMMRSLYLKSTGYYDLHLPKNAPEQTELLREFGMNPGKIVEYSLRCYLNWRLNQQALAK